MKNLNLILFSALVLFVSTAARAQESACSTANLGPALNWKYCIYRYADGGGDVLYYFHGLRGNEKSWETGSVEQTMLATWKKNKTTPRAVVTVSFGEAWFLAQQNASPVSGLYEAFLGAVLPSLQQLVGPVTGKTYLLGLSMGGFNAAQLYMKNPGLFDRVALLCPAMALISPQATDDEIKNYILQTGAKPELVAASLQLGQAFFPTIQDWNQHSPNLLVNGLGPSSAPVYVANGLADAYGFALANERFVNDARGRQVPITSDFYPGQGHCDVDGKKAAMALIPKSR